MSSPRPSTAHWRSGEGQALALTTVAHTCSSFPWGTDGKHVAILPPAHGEPVSHATKHLSTVWAAVLWCVCVCFFFFPKPSCLCLAPLSEPVRFQEGLFLIIKARHDNRTDPSHRQKNKQVQRIRTQELLPSWLVILTHSRGWDGGGWGGGRGRARGRACNVRDQTQGITSTQPWLMSNSSPWKRESMAVVLCTIEIFPAFLVLWRPSHTLPLC